MGRGPIIKKGEGERLENYSRVILMPLLYKIYAMILADKLREEMKRRILSENQTAFRKGMETIDQIYTLNYLINRQLGKERGGLVAIFVDLKAAFDSVNKEILVKSIRERDVRESLMERVEKILKEMKCKVKIGNQGEKYSGWRGE